MAEAAAAAGPPAGGAAIDAIDVPAAAPALASPGVATTHDDAVVYLRTVSRPCLEAFLLEFFGNDLGGYAGHACCYIVEAIATSSSLLSGVRLRDVADVSVSSTDGRLSLGSLPPSHAQYYGAHAHYFGVLEERFGKALYPEFISGVARQLLRAAYVSVHPADPSAGAAVQGPDWPALVTTLAQFASPSPVRPSKICTAIEVGTALRLFNEETKLLADFTDIAGPLACKSILDHLTGGTLSLEGRCAPHTMKSWSSPDGALNKEKLDTFQATDEGIEVRSSLEAAFPDGTSSVSVCSAFELWFRTIHVLSHLVPGRPGFITLGVWNAFVGRMREACSLHTGQSLLMLVIPLIRRGVNAVNLVAVVPPLVPSLTFDAAFLPVLHQLESTLVLSASVLVAFKAGVRPGLGSPGSGGSSPATVREHHLSLRNCLVAPVTALVCQVRGSPRRDAGERSRAALDNKDRQIANLKRALVPPGTSAGLQVTPNPFARAVGLFRPVTSSVPGSSVRREEGSFLTSRRRCSPELWLGQGRWWGGRFSPWLLFPYHAGHQPRVRGR